MPTVVGDAIISGSMRGITRRRRLATARLCTLLLAALWAAACGGGSPTAPSTPVALSITCPSTVTVQANDASPVRVSLPAPTTANGTQPHLVSCLGPPDNLFPVGTTPITCMVTDARQQSTSCRFDVVVQPPPPRILKTSYLAFGDSMTSGEVTVPLSGVDRAGFPLFRYVVTPSASYPTQLLAILAARYTLDAPQLVVTNAGKSGEWAADGARRLPDAYVAARPQVVLLLAGANDIEALGARGLPGAVAALDTMTQYARLGGSDVFVLSLPPARPGGWLTLDATLIGSFNQQLQTVAANRQSTFVDLHTPLSAALTTYIGIDGLHPTEAGYRRIAEVVAEALRVRYERR